MATVTLTKLKFHLLATLDHRGQRIPEYVVAAENRITPITLSQYARGLKPLSQKHLHALCAYFDCEPTDLAGTIDVEVPDPEPAQG